MVLRWRSYLAKNLDFQEDQVVPNSRLRALAHSIYEKESIAVDELAALLQECGVPDKFNPAAKLLLAYLDRSGQMLTRMRDVICRSCNQVGHVVSSILCKE